MKRTVFLSGLAGVVVAVGLLLAVVGVPYGRADLTVFAELYHGEVDTTGQVHMSIDCDLATPGTQDACILSTNPGAPDYLDVGITIGNSTGAPLNIIAFNFTVVANETILDPLPAVPISPYMNGNPDANDALLIDPFWACGPVNPNPDIDPSPAVAKSFISCFNSGDQGFVLAAGAQHELLATVHYEVKAGGTAPLTLEDLNVFAIDDFSYTEVLTCGPGSGTCTGATVTVLSAGDDDSDNIPNGSDNCPFAFNPDQKNTDQNFILNWPYYVVHDVTRANSDAMGDACDPDDDNDGMTDTEELFGCASGQPDPLVADRDTDRFLDSVECDLGTDPFNWYSRPTASQCGGTTDADGDRLMERIEVCFYNTNPAVADTDGDGTKDGCEAVSINGDLVVNSADQLLFSQEHIRVLGGGVGLPNLDLNKDGNYNSIDQLQMAFLIIPTGQCP